MDNSNQYNLASVQAAILEAMANPNRLMILKILIEQEISVGTLANKIGLSQSALSQHLSKLRSMQLVQTRRDAQVIHYSCNSKIVIRLIETLDELTKNTSADDVPRIANKYLKFS